MLSYELKTDQDDPVNPLRHKFHPEHAKGLTITRGINVNFDGSSLKDAPGYGVKRITGTYKETIVGLVRGKIEMAGSITLDRISTVAELNK